MRYWGLPSALPRPSRSGRPFCVPRRSRIERCGTCRGRRSQGPPSCCQEGAGRLARFSAGALHAQLSRHRPVRTKVDGRCQAAHDPAQDTREAAHDRWRKGADGLRKRFPKLAILMGAAERDVLAPRADRLNQCRGLIGTGPMSLASFRTRRPSSVSSAAILWSKTDEWSVQRRYMPLETMKPTGNTDLVRPPCRGRDLDFPRFET